jgi:hypothetical protein
MDWSALVGGLIGAGIPAILAGLGLQRTRQESDAEAFGPAVLLLDRLNPDRVAFNINPDVTAEGAKWAELQRQLDVARERLLIVSAGIRGGTSASLPRTPKSRSPMHSRRRAGRCTICRPTGTIPSGWITPGRPTPQLMPRCVP